MRIATFTCYDRFRMDDLKAELWKQSFNCWLPRISKNSAFVFFRSKTFQLSHWVWIPSVSVQLCGHTASLHDDFCRSVCTEMGPSCSCFRCTFVLHRLCQFGLYPYMLTQSFNWCKSFNAQSCGAWNLKEEHLHSALKQSEVSHAVKHQMFCVELPC